MPGPTSEDEERGEERGGGGADDMRCLLKARIAGANPMSVSHAAATLKEAVAGAADKLETVLQRHFDRQGQVKGRLSFGGAEAE